jgi:hypothetical protein
MDKFVVGEVVGSLRVTILGEVIEEEATVTEVGSSDGVRTDFVRITYSDGKKDSFYLWDVMRYRTGWIQSWPIFDHTCRRLSLLDRLARLAPKEPHG